MEERVYYGTPTSAKVHLYEDCSGMESAKRAGWNVIEYDAEAAARMGVCGRCKARAAKEASNDE